MFIKKGSRSSLLDSDIYGLLRFVGPMVCRTNGVSDRWCVGPMVCRTNGVSDFDFDFVLQQHFLFGVSGWRGDRAGRLSQPADS